jgi:hypothetical protein
MAAKFVPPPPEHLFSGTKYSNFHLKVYTPRVPTSVYMYWVPIIHRIYIPQLNIFITR